MDRQLPRADAIRFRADAARGDWIARGRMTWPRRRLQHPARQRLGSSISAQPRRVRCETFDDRDHAWSFGDVTETVIVAGDDLGATAQRARRGVLPHPRVKGANTRSLLTRHADIHAAVPRDDLGVSASVVPCRSTSQSAVDRSAAIDPSCGEAARCCNDRQKRLTHA